MPMSQRSSRPVDLEVSSIISAALPVRKIWLLLKIDKYS